MWGMPGVLGVASVTVGQAGFHLITEALSHIFGR
jgi:hypothetical protein